MKKILIIIITILLTTISLAQSVGLGIIGSNSVYKTKDSINIIPIPIINLKYDYFIFRETETGFYYDINKNLTIGSVIKYNFEGVDSDDMKDEFKNIDDRKNQVELGLFTEYMINNYQLDLKFYKDISNKSDGYYIDASIKEEKMFNNRYIFSYKFNYTHFDKKYMNYYYGISKEESFKTGLKEDRLKSESKIGVGLDLMYLHSRKIAYGAFAKYDLLSSNHKTAIVDEDKSFNTGLFMIYMWE